MIELIGIGTTLAVIGLVVWAVFSATPASKPKPPEGFISAPDNPKEVVKLDDPSGAIAYLEKHGREIVKQWSVWSLTNEEPLRLEGSQFEPRFLLPDEHRVRAFPVPRYGYLNQWGYITEPAPIEDLYTPQYIDAINDWVNVLWGYNYDPESTYSFYLTDEETSEVRQRVLFDFLVMSGSGRISKFIHESLTVPVGRDIAPGHLVMVDAIEDVVYNEILDRLVAYTSFLPRPHFFELAYTRNPELIMELLQEFKEKRTDVQS